MIKIWAVHAQPSSVILTHFSTVRTRNLYVSLLFDIDRPPYPLCKAAKISRCTHAKMTISRSGYRMGATCGSFDVDRPARPTYVPPHFQAVTGASGARSSAGRATDF